MFVKKLQLSARVLFYARHRWTGALQMT